MEEMVSCTTLNCSNIIPKSEKDIRWRYFDCIDWEKNDLYSSNNIVANFKTKMLSSGIAMSHETLRAEIVVWYFPFAWVVKHSKKDPIVALDAAIVALSIHSFR